MIATAADRPRGPSGAGGVLASPAGRALARNWAACFLLVMLTVFSFTGRNFLEVANFQNVVHLQTLPLLLAAAETLVIITGGIDLSIGTVMTLSSVMAGVIITMMGLPVGLGVVVALLTGGLAGFVNGIVIARMKLPPFIATLGMLNVAKGLSLVISGLSRSETARKTMSRSVTTPTTSSPSTTGRMPTL